MGTEPLLYHFFKVNQQIWFWTGPMLNLFLKCIQINSRLRSWKMADSPIAECVFPCTLRSLTTLCCCSYMLLQGTDGCGRDPTPKHDKCDIHDCTDASDSSQREYTCRMSQALGIFSNKYILEAFMSTHTVKPCKL